MPNYDEYVISLSRERNICAGYVRKYERLIKDMETRYNLTASGSLSKRETSGCTNPVIVSEWKAHREQLERWRAALSEYDGLIAAMKAST